MHDPEPRRMTCPICRGRLMVGAYTSPGYCGGCDGEGWVYEPEDDDDADLRAQQVADELERLRR